MDNSAKISKQLNNSVKIDLGLLINDPKLFNNIHKEIIIHQKNKRVHKKKIETGLSMILANIIYYYRVDKNKYLTIGLNKNFFLKEFNPHNIKYDIAIKVIKFLHTKKYISLHKGYKKNKITRLTRIKSTEKLNSLFKYKRNIFKYDIFNHLSNNIILKDNNKSLINFKKTPLIYKRSKLIEEYNLHFKYNILTINNKILPKPYIYRVFNNKNFKKGGRFYGAYFQQLSKSQRKNIKINGNQTVELDFNCLHINLLYNKIGLYYNQDAYDLPTFPSSKFRKTIKLITLIIINSKSREHAIKSIKYAINTKKIKNINPLIAIEEIEFKHQLIKKYFFKNIGLDLQYQESLICENILKIFLNRKKPLTVLPIHDGFICEISHKNILYRAMKKSFKKITKSSHIKIKEV